MYNFAHHWDYFQNFSILTPPRFMNKQSSDNINSVLKMIPEIWKLKIHLEAHVIIQTKGECDRNF